MKNVLFTALAAIVMLTSACNNLDENLTDSMAAETEARQKNLDNYMTRNQAIAQFNMATANAPIALLNDANTGFATVKGNINMIASKYQSTVDVYIEHITRLKNLQEDYRNNKVKTEETKQEFESINTSFKGIESTFERVDEYYKKTSDEYATILSSWAAANPTNAAAVKEAANRPAVQGISGSPTGAILTAPSAISPSATENKDGKAKEAPKKQ